MNLKTRVEAVLFSAGKYVSVEEIARLCRTDVNTILPILDELKKDYEGKESSLTLINEENKWKLTVREQYIPMVRKIVAETELTKAVMQTLAYIAYKAPILQSDVVSVRSNKAYNHISELESKGFITKTKHGHTFKINLTQKFFEYFDLESIDDIRKRFKRVESSAETDLLKRVEKKPEEKPEVETDKTPEEPQSQIDELKETERKKAIENENKKIDQRFKSLEKEENKEKGIGNKK